jgi:hypothetical protein
MGTTLNVGDLVWHKYGGNTIGFIVKIRPLEGFRPGRPPYFIITICSPFLSDGEYYSMDFRTIK